MIKLTIVDSLLITGVLSVVIFTGYHLFAHSIFDPSSFCEGLMMLIFGKIGHTGAGIADKYFNSPEGTDSAK